MSDQIKAMTEVFEELAVIGDAVSDKTELCTYWPVYRNVLEAQSETVPKWNW